MEQYIKKSDLVAELERRKQVALGRMETAPNDAIEAEFELCDDILSFLDALEVKEVDLVKEAERFVQTKEFIENKESPVILIARHFLERGLALQKEK